MRRSLGRPWRGSAGSWAQNGWSLIRALIRPVDVVYHGLSHCFIGFIPLFQHVSTVRWCLEILNRSMTFPTDFFEVLEPTEEPSTLWRQRAKSNMPRWPRPSLMRLVFHFFSGCDDLTFFASQGIPFAVTARSPTQMMVGCDAGKQEQNKRLEQQYQNFFGFRMLQSPAGYLPLHIARHSVAQEHSWLLQIPFWLLPSDLGPKAAQNAQKAQKNKRVPAWIFKRSRWLRAGGTSCSAQNKLNSACRYEKEGWLASKIWLSNNPLRNENSCCSPLSCRPTSCWR